MDPRTIEQLDKILALADSSHEGEAVGAVRMARQMLERDGLRFGDLAKAAASRPRINLPFSLFSGQQVHLETQLAQVQQKYNDLAVQMEMLDRQQEFWRRRSAELEVLVVQANAEVERWRSLARETAEKLWDLGQEVKADEFASAEAAESVKQRKAS